MEDNYLTLKWGTLKSWNFKGNEEALKLLSDYGQIGASYSCMMQKDTEEQKLIILKLIDLMPGDIYLDWDNKYVSHEDAKNYVINYGKKGT